MRSAGVSCWHSVPEPPAPRRRPRSRLLRPRSSRRPRPPPLRRATGKRNTSAITTRRPASDRTRSPTRGVGYEPASPNVFSRRRIMLLTRKTDTGRVAGPRLSRGIGARIATMDRRAFLKRSGMAAGVGAFASQLPYGTMGKAQAAADTADVKREVHRTVCTHCSVGCSLDAIVENGVWVRQEPVFDSPLNLGAHCAKGASIREHGIIEHSHRLKTPMKLVNGKWQRISWDQALNEVG